MKQRWYVVAYDDYDWKPNKREAIWTLSRNPNATGWETDAAYVGYGLTYAQAKEIADAANNAWVYKQARKNVIRLNKKVTT